MCNKTENTKPNDAYELAFAILARIYYKVVGRIEIIENIFFKFQDAQRDFARALRDYIEACKQNQQQQQQQRGQDQPAVPDLPEPDQQQPQSQGQGQEQGQSQPGSIPNALSELLQGLASSQASAGGGSGGGGSPIILPIFIQL